MRKMIFTLMLAIVSSVWMTSEAACMAQAPNNLPSSYITVNGTIQSLGYPCEEGEECPPCLTWAIVTSDKTYYLSSSNQEVRDFLDRIELAPIPAIYLLPLQARASGTPYTQGSFDFLVVNNIDDLYVQYFSDQLTRLPSLCNEWNVWHESFQSFGPISFDKVVKYQLTTDTIIADSNYYSNYYTLQRYKRLEQDGQYLGAMREGNNRDIYFIPAGSTHEYLLYAFNAQVGDLLTNLYLGKFGEETGYGGFVESISDDSPRVFTIRVPFPEPEPEMESGATFMAYWIEGIGSPETPMGMAAVPSLTVAADVGTYTLLCAYKNKEQIYVSEMGQQYGCEYNGKPAAKPSSLCDEWNILEVSNVTCGYCEVYRTYNSRLTTDTVISGIRYTQLVEDDAYRGALREGLNRDIYYIPAGSAHEYLLYAFNAQEGDQLTNLWIGGSPADSPDGWAMTVEEIQETTPRTFVLSTGYTHTDGGIENYPLYITWIEGVGMDGPVGDKRCVGCADSRAYGVLCAYKNGEHVYTSEWGEQYGCEYNGNGTPEPMFTSDTKWHYKSYDMFAYTDYTPTLSSISLVDTLINNIPYQKIGGILFRTKGTKVWCTMDSLGTPVERLVYDFGLQVGDSIRNVYYDEEFWMEQEYIRYAKVTSVEYITLSDGRSARRISYDNYRPDDIEHIGSVEGILFPLNFPVAECGCGDAFKCCTRNDFLLYEVSTGGCDEFFEAEQPADTIPLFSYTGDDPGSSTVDPVDPNQVIVTLKGDELTVKEMSGEEITLELSLTDNRNQMPALNRVPETETFRNEVTITLTEEGIYTLELTNPSWGYHIYGTFDYPQRKDAIDQNIVPQPAAEKIIRNGQLLIRKGEKVYTVQGQEVK